MSQLSHRIRLDQGAPEPWHRKTLCGAAAAPGYLSHGSRSTQGPTDDREPPAALIQSPCLEETLSGLGLRAPGPEGPGEGFVTMLRFARWEAMRLRSRRNMCARGTSWWWHEVCFSSFSSESDSCRELQPYWGGVTSIHEYIGERGSCCDMGPF